MNIETFKDRDKKARKLIQSPDRLARLIAEMDSNRSSLGDACRVCGERTWSGVDGKRPHHKYNCPVGMLSELVGLDVSIQKETPIYHPRASV